MRAFVFASLSVLFALRPAVAQIDLRLLETPVQGADATFGVHAGAGRPFLLLLSAGTGGLDALDVFDRIDPRHLGVDLSQVRYVAEGTLDAHGDAVVLVPASYLQAFQAVPFFAQALTYPGFATSVDELSNVVSSRVGTGIGSVTGLVLDEADQPIVGAIVEIVENTARRTVTAANGTFRIDRVRPGRVHVAVDATQVNAGPGANFARIVLPIDIEDGLVNPVGYTVFIPRAVGGTLITAGTVGGGGATTQPITVTGPTPEGPLVLTIPTGTTITFGDGTHSGKTIQVLRVPSDHTPMPMPDDVLPRWDYAIYPPDVRLVPAVPFTFWTDQVLTVGSEWDFKAPDHESIPMQFVTRGLVRVLQSSAAGSQCSFFQGGMTGGGWGTMFRAPGGGPDKGPEDPPGSCPIGGSSGFAGFGGGEGGDAGRGGMRGIPNGPNCSVEPITGNLLVDLSSPPHRVGSQDLGLQFVYNSDRAAAQILFSATASMNALAMVPERYTLSGSLGGVAMQELFYDAGTRGLQPFQLVQSVSAPSLPTGEHPYRVLLKSIVQGSQFARPLEGRRVVENFADSPFGAGWTLVGHDRITRLDGQKLLLSRGDGSRSIFKVHLGSTAFAGTGIAGLAGDGGRAVQALLRRPGHVAVRVGATTGDLVDVFFVDAGNQVVRSIDAFGVIRTFAGTPGLAGSSGDGGPATAARLDFTLVPGVQQGGVAVDSQRNRLYIADLGNHRVRVVDLLTGTISTFAGNGLPGFAGDMGPAAAARLQRPSALAVEPQTGALWIADTGNQVLRRVEPDGSRILTVAGSPGIRGFAGDGGPAWRARLNNPAGLAIDRFGSVYVADQGNNLVRRITVNGRIETFLGQPGRQTPISVGLRLLTAINAPADIAIDDEGDVYVALAGSDQVARVRADNDLVELLVPSSTVQVAGWTGLAILPGGVLVAVASNQHQLHKFDLGDYLPVKGRQDNVISERRGGGFLHRLADLSLRRFDATGRLVDRRWPDGRTQRWEYIPATDLLDRIVLPNGEVFAFAYDSSGKLSTVTDPAGRVSSATITNGDLTQWTTPGPLPTQPSVVAFAYSNHRIDQMTDPGGAVTAFTRNGANQYIGALQTGPGLGAGRVWHNEPFGYPGLPHPGSAPGTQANPLPSVAPGGDVTHVDPVGNTHRYVLDPAAGWVVRYTDPLGNVTTFVRDACGQVTQQVRPGGATTNLTYDAQSRLLTQVDPLGRTWTLSYDSVFPTPTQVTDPAGQVWLQQLHPLHGRTVTSIDPRGRTVHSDYDVRGRRIAEREAFGAGERIVTSVYDSADRLVQRVDANGGVTLFTYTADGQLATRTDALGRVTTYGYDAAGNLTTLQRPGAGTTTFRYDAMRQLVEVIDAKVPAGHTLFQYDGAGRRVGRTDPMGGQETMAYDAMGNLVLWTTRDGDTITYSYDPMGRLLGKSLGATVLATFAYDARGNLLRADNARSRLGFGYDLADRMVTQDTAGSLDQPAALLTVGYGPRNEELATSALGYTASLSYDSRGDLAQVRDNLGAQADLTLDQQRRRTRMLRSNGVPTDYAFDANDEIAAIAHQAPLGGLVLSSWSYARNALGYPTTVTENRGGVFASGGNAYGYDVANRLTSAAHPDPQNPAENFGYDAVGNRLHGGAANVDLADRLQSDGAFAYTYDQRGNQRQQVAIATGATTQYDFDAEGQLTDVRIYAGAPTGSPVTSAQYAYDALGRRVRRVVTGVGAMDQSFVLRGDRVFVLRDNVAGVAYGYLRGAWVDEVVASTPIAAAAHVWCLASDLNSIEACVDAAGLLRRSQLYAAFGAVAGAAGVAPRADEALFGFTGREGEVGGLRFHRARFFDGRSGRALAEDPIWRAGVQAFAVVDNAPTRWVDANGRELGSGGSGSRAGIAPVVTNDHDTNPNVHHIPDKSLVPTDTCSLAPVINSAGGILGDDGGI